MVALAWTEGVVGASIGAHDPFARPLAAGRAIVVVVTVEMGFVLLAIFVVLVLVNYASDETGELVHATTFFAAVGPLVAVVGFVFGVDFADTWMTATAARWTGVLEFFVAGETIYLSISITREQCM